MTTKHQKFKIKLPTSYSGRTRMAIAQEVIDQIIQRTQKKNVDKAGKKFPKYTKGYTNSPEFKAGGGSKAVDLTLSGDMLSELRLLNQKKGEITIGYKKGTEENAKADGNIRGTYGKPKADRKKARDFLGVSAKEMKAIRAKYPVRNLEKQKQRVELMDLTDKTADQITGGITVARLEEESEE